MNQIYKYIWLVDTLYNARKISFQDLNRLWLNNDISEGMELSKRTFHKWRNAVEDIFGLVIDNENQGKYRYYIANAKALEKNYIHQWMIHTLSVSHLLMQYPDLHEVIDLEEVPSSQPYLARILEAIRGHNVMKITYQSFRKSHSHSFRIHPYAIKLFHQRWYVVACSPHYPKIMIYALDRVLKMEKTTETFDTPVDFSVSSYFKDCYGVIAHDGTTCETVQLKVFGRQVHYFRTLPLHASQTESTTEKEYSIFNYQLYPTFDFRKELLSYGSSVEVLSPAWLRKEMAKQALKMIQHYQ